MNALTRLKTYSSSDSEDNDNECQKQSVERLPVPEIFIKKTENLNGISHKEENKDGKIRNFPHEPGIWATYVYFPVEPFPELLDYLETLEEFLQPLKVNLVDDFHISLTRTVILRYHWIHGFTEAVRKRLSGFHSFEINLRGLKVYTNEEKTRTFLSITVEEGFKNLSSVVSELDSCLEEYKLKPFYEEQSFHLSVLWCSGDKYNEINAAVSNFSEELKTFSFLINVTHCICTSVTYNLLLVACLLFNTTELIRESKCMADSQKTNILFKISFDSVEVCDNLHLCFVGIRCLILWTRGNLIWDNLIALNKELKDLNVEFNKRKFRFCLCIKLAIFIGFYVIFWGMNAILLTRSSVRNYFFRMLSLVPLIINFLFDAAFASVMMLIYRGFKVINNFLISCTKRYAGSDRRDIEDSLNAFDGTTGKNFQTSYLSLPRKFRWNVVGIFKFYSFKCPPSPCMTKNYKKFFVVDDFNSRRNLVDSIQYFKVLHFELYAVADSFNSILGFSWFFIFVTSFFGCIINLYFVISFHLNSLDADQYFSTLSRMIYYLFRVLLVIYCLDKLSAEANRAVDLLLLFLNETNVDELQNELKSFCLQAQDCQLQFKAAGLFIIDHSTLFQFVAGVLSNVLFIVQFN